MFCGTFILAAALSLTYVYTRPAEYRAVSRLQISPARIVGEADAITPPTLQDQPESFLTEVQVLTSRPLLQAAIDRLKNAGTLPSLGPDPVDAVQRMLRAEPVEGTQIVQLSAEGPQQSFVSQLVNTVAEAYRERIVESYQGSASSTNADVSDEAKTLQQQVAAKRTEVDAFRARYDIVSLEREENGVLAKIQGLSRSYATSNEVLARAQGRLQALQNAAASEATGSAKDDPTLAAIEQRTSVLREELRALQLRFTPDYLARDANATGLQARIANLEQQLKARHIASQQAAMATAQEELSTSQSAVNRLQKDLNENQQAARQFATRLAEYKVMQDDLDHLQALERAVLDRLTKLRSSERERAPRVELLELAAASLTPWRPDYNRDALISLAGSLVFGLFAVWFTGFIGGPAPARTTMIHHALAPPPVGRFIAPSPRHLSDPGLVQLPAREPPPRELDDSEIAALLSNASEDVCLVSVALLTGLSPAEIVALKWDQIDFASGTMNVGGEAARTLRLEEPLATLLNRRRQGMAEGIATVLHDGRGSPSTMDELGRIVLCGAYDAGLDRPQQITPAALRHTYLAFLLWQGIRAADIGRIAGHIPNEDLAAYMQLAPPGTRLPLEQIDRVHRALRDLAGRAST